MITSRNHLPLLIARIHALVRRVPDATHPYGLQTFSIDLRDAGLAGQTIDLQPRGICLYSEYLMRNAGRVVLKTMIMEHVWIIISGSPDNVVVYASAACETN